MKSAQKKIDKVLDIDVGEPDYDEEQHSGSQQEEEFLSGDWLFIVSMLFIAILMDCSCYLALFFQQSCGSRCNQHHATVLLVLNCLC